ncbi:MAG: hypothetical protein KGK08_06870 [Acidobacteriota bacterium]|nr:hypothetical protein [Acidobacteriota bacterium]
MLPIVAVWIWLFFLAMLAFVVDFGQIYFYYSDLRASTEAAAMAGAEAMTAGTNPTTVATSYSGVAGNYNVTIPGVSIASGYPKYQCSTTLQNSGTGCITYTGGGAATANEVIVQQQVSVPLYFTAMLGIHSTTLSYTATAEIAGAAAKKYNVAVVIDTTGSMSSSESGETGCSTRIACALLGFQTLMKGLTPCTGTAASCGTVTATNAVDRVALYTFPGFTSTSYATQDSNCSGRLGNSAIAPYSFTNGVSSTIYQVINFAGDYKSGSGSTTLNTSSTLAKSAGTSGSGCSGLQDIGGSGTYYAGVIAQAQSDLVAAQTASTAAGVETYNVMIILSDGDASSSRFSGASNVKPAAGVAATYPSSYDQCQQAISQAQAATAAGTRVITVAYGASSSGCSTDVTGPLKGISPCQAMQDMASNVNLDFFTDVGASQNAGQCNTPSGALPASNLNTIFSEIAGSLSTARLVPNGT